MTPASLTLPCRYTMRWARARDSGNTLGLGILHIWQIALTEIRMARFLQIGIAWRQLRILQSLTPLTDLPTSAPPVHVHASYRADPTASQIKESKALPKESLTEPSPPPPPKSACLWKITPHRRYGKPLRPRAYLIYRNVSRPPPEANGAMKDRASDGRDVSHPSYPRGGHRDDVAEKSGKCGPVDKSAKRGQSGGGANSSQKGSPASETQLG